jgi:PAS domain S-box-containing protein
MRDANTSSTSRDQPNASDVAARLGAATLREAPNLIDLLPVGVYACDAKGRVLWFNRHAALLWGRTGEWAKDEFFCGAHRLCDIGGAPIDRQDSAMAQVLRTGKALTNRSAVFERPDDSRVFVVASVEPVFNDEGSLVGAVSCIHEAHGLIQPNRKVNNGEWQSRALLDALPVAIYTTDAEGHLLYYNDAAAELWGRRPVVGNDQWCGSWRLYWPEGRPMKHEECPMALTLKSGKPVRGYEAIAEKPDGTRVPFIPYPTPILNEAGDLIGAVNMLVDITDRKRAEERQQVLLDELNHRVKNSLATVQSLATQSFRDVQDTATSVADFEARLIAFSRAHDLLTREQWHSAELKSLIEAALVPYRQAGAERVVLSGPRVRLSPRAALTLTLVIHELASNAAKYGSLSTSDGSLLLEWRLEQTEEAPILVIDWRERGGPPVSKPRRYGFGIRLIERSVEHEMNGLSTITFDPKGLACRITVPLD